VCVISTSDEDCDKDGHSSPCLKAGDSWPKKLKLILREALTHSEMMIDDIAARYITQQHGCKLAVAVDAAEDAYAAAQNKAEKAMGLTR